jgi:hypothetical protein
VEEKEKCRRADIIRDSWLVAEMLLQFLHRDRRRDGTVCNSGKGLWMRRSESRRPSFITFSKLTPIPPIQDGQKTIAVPHESAPGHLTGVCFHRDDFRFLVGSVTDVGILRRLGFAGGERGHRPSGFARQSVGEFRGGDAGESDEASVKQRAE